MCRRVGCIPVAALLLAGCGSHQPSTVAYQLTTADVLFVNDIRANTRTFYAEDDAEIALNGQGVCDVLARGGTDADAIALLPVRQTVRGKLDSAYFVGAAAHRFCPQYPTTKPAP